MPVTDNLKNNVYSKSINTTNIPPKQTKVLETIKLPAGTYLAIGHGEIDVSASNTYALELHINGNVFVRTRNISMLTGGGGNVCGIASLESPGTISLAIFSNHTSEVNTSKFELHIIKLN